MAKNIVRQPGIGKTTFCMKRAVYFFLKTHSNACQDLSKAQHIGYNATDFI